MWERKLSEMVEMMTRKIQAAIQPFYNQLLPQQLVIPSPSDCSFSSPVKEYIQQVIDSEISADDESEDTESETADGENMAIEVKSVAENYRKTTAGSNTGVSEMVVKSSKRNLKKKSKEKSKKQKKKKRA